MKYYATKRNVQYIVEEDEAEHYRIRGFRLTPVEQPMPVVTDVVINEVPVKPKRGRKPKNQTI